jgi:hypothetical protein
VGKFNIILMGVGQDFRNLTSYMVELGIREIPVWETLN